MLEVNNEHGVDMEKTNTRWITVDEMMNRLSISKTKAYDLAHDGSLETVKIGSSLRINEESLTRWLESVKQTRALGGHKMQ